MVSPSENVVFPPVAGLDVGVFDGADDGDEVGDRVKAAGELDGDLVGAAVGGKVSFLSTIGDCDGPSVARSVVEWTSYLGWQPTEAFSK